VTQLLLQIPAAHAGDILTVKVVDENNQWTSAADDGGLFDPVVGTPSNAAGSLTVTAQGSSYPMAVAMYLAPTNFHRGTQDDSSVKRAITFTVSTSGNAQCPGNNGQTSTASTAAIIVRPPVVLVHGLWSSGTGTWALFSPQNSQNWSLWADMNPEGQEVDYSSPVGITASTPSYSPNPTVTEAALGFSYNAPSVLLQTRTFIHNYGIHWKVAAVQGDVVAHSMGGDIVRTMGALSNYTTQSDYGLGPIHKLITIGTPHRGTPVAVDLLPSGLGDANACVRDALATKSNPSFQTVTLATGIVVNGAVGDLAAAPTNLPPTEPFPMAYLAATTNAANLANVDSLGSTSYWLRLGCITLFGNSGLAYDLTPSLWNNVFGGEANDGVVPITSQLNQTGSLLQAAGGQSANTFQGIIHSPGFEALNFSPPTEVGPQNSIADAVVNLLNEATNGPDFH
jgi:hypothetical protein